MGLGEKWSYSKRLGYKMVTIFVIAGESGRLD
jgi:hypothetical protein